MKNGAWIIAGIAAIAAGYFILHTQPLPFLGGIPPGVVCTMEAKACPDGSYVGRTGPDCEFAPCPTATSTPTSTAAQMQARIGQATAALGATISPIAVTQDSRCPVDVQCIQAGTVQLRAQVTDASGTTEKMFTLDKAVIVGTRTITLIDVRPDKRSTQTLSPSDYVFTFDIRSN